MKSKKHSCFCFICKLVHILETIICLTAFFLFVEYNLQSVMNANLILEISHHVQKIFREEEYPESFVERAH
jgi:hypothetical protein